jgi:hypothetical protein
MGDIFLLNQCGKKISTLFFGIAVHGLRQIFHHTIGNDNPVAFLQQIIPQSGAMIAYTADGGGEFGGYEEEGGNKE